MNILGLYGAYCYNGMIEALHDSSATLVIDGNLVVSISEERLTRRKYESRFPKYGINYVLNATGLKNKDIDIVTLADQPVYEYAKAKASGKIHRILKKYFPNAEIQFFDHHRCHAASTIFTSGLNNTSIFTLDGGGSTTFDSLHHGYKVASASRSMLGFYNKKKRFFNVYDVTFDHLKNTFGAVYCDYANDIYKAMFPNKQDTYPWEIYFSSPGKIMGLSAYGNSDNVHESFYRVDWLGEGRPPVFTLNKPTKDWFEKYDPIDIAAFLQKNFEKAFLTFITQLVKDEYLSKKVCLAGGVFLNISCNTLLHTSKLFEDIHIVPFVNDSGLSIGSALYGAYLQKEKIVIPKNLATLGKLYTKSEIKTALKTYNLDYVEYDNFKELCKVTAGLLNDNKIIGWFQNKSEQGPRALGSRSILMSCTNPDNKDILNSRIKHREYWRPFAGAVLEEFHNKYFVEDFVSPYMLYNYTTKPNARHIIPAINHVDNTCRVQSVNKTMYPELFTLLTEYNKLTNNAILLNTSFNDNAEPIVETPAHAVKCFKNIDLDYLVIGNFLVSKNRS
jgi:carbamoyltransferase